jgi:hypothetical protein
VGGDAARIAAAMAWRGLHPVSGMMVLATSLRDIVFHTEQPVTVVMMGNHRYHRHQQTDEQQQASQDLLSLFGLTTVSFHSTLLFLESAKIKNANKWLKLIGLIFLCNLFFYTFAHI